MTDEENIDDDDKYTPPAEPCEFCGNEECAGECVEDDDGIGEEL